MFDTGLSVAETWTKLVATWRLIGQAHEAAVYMKEVTYSNGELRIAESAAKA